MTDHDPALVERVAKTLWWDDESPTRATWETTNDYYPQTAERYRSKARAVLAAVWDDLPAAQPTVDDEAYTAEVIWDKSAEFIVHQAEVTSPEYALERADRFNRFNPFRQSPGWIPPAQPTVDGYELAKQLHLHHRAYEVQPPCDMCKAQAGALLASGVLTDAGQVRADAQWTDEQVKRAAARLREIEVAAVSGIPVEDNEWAAREVLEAAVRRRDEPCAEFGSHRRGEHARIAREHAASDRKADHG